MRVFAGRIFLAPFPLALRSAAAEAYLRGHAEAQYCPWAKLNYISGYQQELVGRLGSNLIASDLAALKRASREPQEGLEFAP